MNSSLMGRRRHTCEMRVEPLSIEPTLSSLQVHEGWQSGRQLARRMRGCCRERGTGSLTALRIFLTRRCSRLGAPEEAPAISLVGCQSALYTKWIVARLWLLCP